MFEIKGEKYAALVQIPQARDNIEREFLDQSARQIAASGGRAVVWIFAEPEAARFTRDLFDAADEGRENITVGYIPWSKKEPR